MARSGSPFILAVLLVAGVLLGGRPASAQSFVVEATTVAPNPVAPGGATSVTTTILETGGAAAGILVDMEIWNAAGTRVYQQVVSGLVFQAGERKTFGWTWTVPPSQPVGTYRVTIGVFSNDWSTLYQWVNQAASATVQAGSGGGGGPPSFGVETTTVTPSPVTRGTSATIATTIVNGGGPATGILVDMEVWNAAGAKVHQQLATGQTFQAGERKALQWTWAVPASQATGPYRIAIGVFTGDWATLYAWVGSAATFTVQSTPTFTLAVTRTGGGTGTVTSTPAGIACGTDCGEAYAGGTAVTLTATPAAGSTFAGWSGGGCAGVGACTVTLSGNASVAAAFTAEATLTVAKAGPGSGTVSSSPAGIACGTDCSQAYAGGTAVTLTATPAAGSTFAGWSGGGCAGSGACTVTLTGNTTVTATFGGPVTLAVTKAGTGTGRVAGAPGGIDCGADCARTYPSGTAVTLTAAADPGFVFAGWSGGACGGTGACSLTLQASSTVTATFTPPVTDNPVVVENRLPGSAGWQIGQVAEDWTKQIKGYASATSVRKGGSLAFHVTVNPAQGFTIDFYRLGWYGGLGGRLMLRAGPLPGFQQAACPLNGLTGLIACAWSPSYTLTVPDTWTSGVYVAVLTNAGGWQNYVPFVVADDRPAPILYQMSVTTYQAYNSYPNDGSGKSLYGFNSGGGTTMTGERRAVAVSFDRPYHDNGVGQLFHWEIHMIRWLERSGYDVTYSTNLDTHTQGARLRHHRAFLSVGHDEYWSKEMFDAVEAARDAGVSLGFFGANAAYWQVRFEASASGIPNRVMVCYKDSGLDPEMGVTATVRFRQPPVHRPEQTLIGIQYTSYVDWFSMASYIVQDSGHPVYAGTGFHDGDAVPGIVGYEMDRTMPEYPLPAHRTRAILSWSPYFDINGNADHAESAIYQAPGGAWVFAAGTISWSWGLDDLYNGRADARIQKATDNVLGLFLGQPLAALPGGLLAGAAPGSR